MRQLLALFILSAVLPSPAFARNIVLSNDDGLTSNVVALYSALKAEGHDVIVSVPCTGQSGMGAAIYFMRPISPLTSPCLNDAAKPGDPGVGPMTREGFSGDFHYVNGTPVMALLYAIDVQALARWGRPPDLILSGPNEGQNLGSIVISSGTVSVAQYGAIRGIPSIALSADSSTADNPGLANPASDQIAKLTVILLKRLEKSAADKPLLPVNTTLNVNFPRLLDNPKWRMSRIGSYDAFKVKFVADLAADPTAKTMAPGMPQLPGITVEPNRAKHDATQSHDETIVNKNDIAVSVMQTGYGVSDRDGKQLRRTLRDLIEQD